MTPWTAGHQASLSITNSQSLLKFMSESMMPSNHLILCCPLLLLLSIFPRIRVFSNESVLRIRWPKCWNFSFTTSHSNEHSELISFRLAGWISLQSLQSKGLSRVFSQHHSSKASILQLADGDTEILCEAGHVLQALENAECGIINYNKSLLWASLVAQW